MEDIERYGDYNEIDEAPGGDKNHVVTLLKILIISLCVLVIGVIVFRLVLFNYYPDETKTLYFNDELTEYYNDNGGNIDAITQSMRAPYDDPDFASFMADNLIVIKAVGQLQLSVRYNSSVFDTIEEKYGVRLDKNRQDHFSFELEYVPYDKSIPAYKIGELDYLSTDTALMYTYYKLAFDGVEFKDENDWIRLKITINDIPDADPYYILVYENVEKNTSEYELSTKERPNG
jgi:hypothetical protein